MASFLPCTLDTWPPIERDAWIDQFPELSRQRRTTAGHRQLLGWLHQAPYGAINLIQAHHPPLFAAVDQPTPRLLRAFIDAGLRYHAPLDPRQSTVFDYCIEFWAETDGKKSVLPHATLLIEAGMPVDEVHPKHTTPLPGTGGNTPLKQSVVHRDRALFDYLLEQGANPAHRDNDGFCVLDHCIRSKLPEWFLDLENHPHLSPLERDPNRLLVVAAQSGSAQMVDLLLARGAQVSPPVIQAAEQSLRTLQSGTFPPTWDVGPSLRNAQGVLARLRHAQLDGTTPQSSPLRVKARL